MVEFFDWIAGGSISAIVFIAMTSLLISSVIVIYVVSFLQGREISFWPPKISEKPERKKQVVPEEKSETVSLLTVDEVLTTEPVSLEDSLADASELYIVAMNMRRTLTNHYGCFEEQLLEGADLRFLLVDPYSDAIPIIAERNYVYTDAKQLSGVIQSTLDNLARLCANQPKKGKIEVRTLCHVPAYGLTLFNPERPNGRIRVDMYPYRVPPDTYPSFWVDRRQDEHWYEFFLNQFYLMWHSGEPYRVQE